MQAITVAEKTKFGHKNQQSQWTVKYRSRTSGSRCVLNEYVTVSNAQRKLNFERTEIFTLRPHPAISRCDKKWIDDWYYRLRE